ncbi:DeoR/GlpR family DNA-binding transcription regulator [Burkholderia gladioli]|uniref:DeoR-like helix-turn-helix domain protein n=1 Tax=Burkholderia gladioli TaxID=28095 RepID=A0AAW3ESU7_BURGA|nr:DeoR/GlpR family DNA-binding transcription regulator [Burkholderia gladioli]AJW98065.1 deoR-like helix-turn-helix domain protein [Burkholderia gladioli]ASD78651.1 DeoR/GlpR transcriptional regulator [Burkholderia gladioli pv. gladioli]AWY56105.1 DeoR/GlpR transcriptional regulator [Burkholderia gladioli pv. gladioli]KGC10171.1 deoR-like helix-turn-helix domain protein [Burkholderia gladioli]MDJ1162842.1 DeoR/GlpR family DNA-binding transcription regulator [Burkholderia gladioli pv. gladioli
MWQEDRHQRIRALLIALHRVSTERIMAELGVSRETVRRDLLDLETLGELVRVRGGAIRPDAPAAAIERAPARERVERAIAKAAAAQVGAGQTLFLDADSRSQALADELVALEGLTILTNSLDVVARLRAPLTQAANANQVIMLGGAVPARTLATASAETVREIQRHRADLALLAPDGLDARHGASHVDRAQAEVARAMCEAADRVVMLADAARLGLRSRVSYCAADAIDLLVTERGAAGADAFAALERRLPKVLLA